MLRERVVRLLIVIAHNAVNVTAPEETAVKGSFDALMLATGSSGNSQSQPASGSQAISDYDIESFHSRSRAIETTTH